MPGRKLSTKEAAGIILLAAPASPAAMLGLAHLTQLPKRATAVQQSVAHCPAWHLPVYGSIRYHSVSMVADRYSRLVVYPLPKTSGGLIVEFST